MEITEFWTCSDAARELERSPAMVKVYERDGRLPCIRTPSGMRLFRPSDVLALKAARAAKAQAAAVDEEEAAHA